MTSRWTGAARRTSPGITRSPGARCRQLPTTGGAFQSAFAGLTDCFISRVNARGSALGLLDPIWVETEDNG